MPSSGKQKAAGNAITRAVMAGRMQRPDNCELCGVGVDPIGHHYLGYDHPLDVWWICRACNKILEHRHDGSLTIAQARALVKSRGVKMETKTDNGNLNAKLALRRYFLDKYHADAPPRVLDCCQGQGVIWTELRKEYAVASYWGLDMKPKSGRLKMASERLLCQPGWNQNVIDIDTYASPWKHWRALLPNVQCPATVFLTIGGIAGSCGRPGGDSLQTVIAAALGLGSMKIPNAMGHKLNVLGVSYMLALASEFGKQVAEAVEAESTGNARYIGVRLTA